MIRSYPLSSLVAYPTKGKLAAFPVSTSQQIFLFNARAFNNSGGTINVGLMQRMVYPRWNLYQFTNTGPVFTSVGSAINAGTTTAIFSGTANDGYVVQSRDMFGMIGLSIVQQRAGGVYEYTYWNGSSFVTLTTLEVANYNSVGDNWTVFQPPSDWVVGGTAGLNQSEYSIRVRSTTPPAVGSVTANTIWVAKFLEFYEGIPNNASVQMSFPDSKPLLLEGGETLIPYFSSAAAANQVGAYYAFNGD